MCKIFQARNKDNCGNSHQQIITKIRNLVSFVMSSTTTAHPSSTNSRRNSDKPHVSIDIGKHTDGQEPSGHYQNEQRLPVDDGSVDESKNKKDGKPSTKYFLKQLTIPKHFLSRILGAK